MSNALAIANVTQALALLIENNLHPEIDMAVSVETRRPPAEPPTEPTITVFLYQVTPNASMRHHDLPTRAPDGTLLKRAAAPLDLHYVITAYGEETELVGQRLIGCVVRTLHEIPVLPRELIEEAATRPYLEGSDLAESVQKVRFTPTQMDVDETSKLWGMLHQTPYALSVVYTGALVFLEGREQPTPAKPVERHTVRVAPFGAPGAPERPDLPEPRDPGSAVGATGGPDPDTAVSRASDVGGAKAERAANAAGGRETGGSQAAGRAGSRAETAGREAEAPSAAKKRAAAKSAPKQGESSSTTSRSRKATGTRGGGRSGAPKSTKASKTADAAEAAKPPERGGGSDEA